VTISPRHICIQFFCRSRGGWVKIFASCGAGQSFPWSYFPFTPRQFEICFFYWFFLEFHRFFLVSGVEGFPGIFALFFAADLDRNLFVPRESPYFWEGRLWLAWGRQKRGPEAFPTHHPPLTPPSFRLLNLTTNPSSTFLSPISPSPSTHPRLSPRRGHTTPR